MMLSPLPANDNAPPPRRPGAGGDRLRGSDRSHPRHAGGAIDASGDGPKLGVHGFLDTAAGAVKMAGPGSRFLTLPCGHTVDKEDLGDVLAHEETCDGP